jgi:hypothetical protein
MPPTPVTPDVLDKIAQAVRSIHYGTVQVTVHNARVVQIDKVEKLRLVHDVEDAGPSSSNPPSDRSSGGFRHQSAQKG